MNGTLLMSPRRIDRTFAAPERDVDYVLDRREAPADLLRAIPPRHAEVVRLFYLSDVPADTIAARLGLSAAQARELLEDAEGRMREVAKVYFPHLCTNGNGR